VVCAAAFIDAVDAGLEVIKSGSARIVILADLEGDASNVVWVRVQAACRSLVLVFVVAGVTPHSTPTTTSAL